VSGKQKWRAVQRGSLRAVNPQDFKRLSQATYSGSGPLPAQIEGKFVFVQKRLNLPANLGA
jgi:hypothetical protein